MMSITIVSGLLSLITATGAHMTLAVTNNQTVPETNQQTTTIPMLMPQIENVTESQSKTTEQFVREYFADIPILAEVSRCESTFRQYDKDGKVLRGIANHYDLGLMQINELYHAKQAETLGFDIYTPEGNLAYARYLYGKEGLKPWISSSKCWNSPASMSAVADRA